MDERKPFEEWVAAKKPAAWQAAAAKAMRAWAIGQEVTEDEFDRAIHDAANVQIGVQTKR